MPVYQRKPPRVTANVYSAANPPANAEPIPTAWMNWKGVAVEDDCEVCGIWYGGHIWVGTESDGRPTCPGDYIVPATEEQTEYSVGKQAFESQWELAPS